MLLAPDRTKSRPDFRGIDAVAVDIDLSVHGVPPSAGPQSSGQTHAAPYRDPPPVGRLPTLRTNRPRGQSLGVCPGTRPWRYMTTIMQADHFTRSITLLPR